MAEQRKRIAHAKGRYTKMMKQLHTQEGLPVERRSQATLKHLKELVQRSEDDYNEAYEILDDPTAEEATTYADFTTATFETQMKIDAMCSQLNALHVQGILNDELNTWEGASNEELTVTFATGQHQLEELFSEFKGVAHTPGLDGMDDFKRVAMEFRKRLNKLCQRATVPTTTTKESTDVSGSIKQGMKAKTIPLPTFDGSYSDWRSFWKRLNDYLDKLCGITDSDKLSYLLDAIKDPAGKEIVSDAIRNGDSYECVDKELHIRYDQPRKVLIEAVGAVKSLPEFHYTRDDLDAIHREVTKYRNVIQKYGDGSADQILTALVEGNMKDKLLMEWRLTCKDVAVVPPIDELLKFCATRSSVLSEHQTTGKAASHLRPNQQRQVTPNGPRPFGSGPTLHKPPQTRPVRASKTHTTTLHNADTALCKVCKNEEHLIYQCQKFQEMDVPTRRHTLRGLQCCFNCLNDNHQVRQCYSRKSCRECGGRHHTLLHEGRGGNQTSQDIQQPAATAPAPPATNLTSTIPDKTSLLLSCQVVAEAGGRELRIRAMLDAGSTLSFLTNRVANQLKMTKIPCITDVAGLQSTCTATSQFRVTFNVKSFNNKAEPAVTVTACLVKSITGKTPAQDLSDHRETDFVRRLQLADPDFGLPGDVDLLLGQDVIPKIIRGGNIRSSEAELYATETMFGWVVGGLCSTPMQAATTHVCCLSNTTDVEGLLRTFWETEEVPKDIPRSPDDQKALTIFRETTTQEEDGRYRVRLPKREETLNLGQSREQAVQRYKSNKRNLQRRGKWNAFAKAVAEYEEMGHAEPVPAEELDLPDHSVYYLPMHGVTKESSTTTKLRIVFDASAKTSSGLSLNDCLLPGPTMYPLLSSILIRFRLHRIAMSADVSKMFREISLHPEDRNLHRYVSADPQGDLQELRMTRVTFGVNSSPFLATQTLRRLADDYQSEYPEAAEVVRCSFYVDDCLTGADNLNEAKHLRGTLNQLLSKACMTLRKWRSSSAQLKSTIPEHLLEDEPELLITTSSNHHKALGLHWDTKSDHLHVSTPQLTKDVTPTKRQVLSDVARTFDVLGMFTPVIVTLKILLQRIWQRGMDWDEKLSEDLAEVWRQWRDQLHLVREHPIQRPYMDVDKDIYSTQIHGFCDASTVAYAGVVYIRLIYTDGSVSTSVVLSKSKVAPLKPLTIPKLELCAASLLSDLLTVVKKELSISLAQTFAWSDSTITLGWIQTHPSQLKMYVANRVVNIVDNIPPGNWRYVPTAQNPADVASRGTSARHLIEDELWWKGPPWLCRGPDHWPSTNRDPPSSLPELKRVVVTLRAEPVEPEDYTLRFSNYNRLVRVCARICRFLDGLRGKLKGKTMSRSLTTEEVKMAETLLIRLHQMKYLAQEQELLRSGKAVERSSPLYPLRPFLDQSGIIRVGGRLNQADLTYQTRHPIILSKKAHLTKLLIRYLHESHHHAGPTLLLSLLSHEFYVIGARSVVRQVSRQCVICQREYARTGNQLMGDLPAARLRPSPPFTRVGVDYAGPLTLKRGYTRKPSYIKAYVALFVCLVTKAVHLELVGDLSTESFIATLTRFTARRGYPSEIWSDNGTNFVGANHELGRLYDQLESDNTKEQIYLYCTNRRIEWHFSPSRAPHFGGLWEAGIKAAKTLLRKSIGTYPMTCDEYHTVLCDVEATLNSRPLCAMNTLPDDGIETLTPGHFLVGRALKSLPQPLIDDTPISSLKRWNLCRRLANHFWERWSTEYLSLMQKRQKWQNPKPNYKVNDIVLVKDKDLFVRSWPIARITATHPGTDGLVRAVTIRTAKGVLTRPVNKLVHLVSADQESMIPSSVGGGCSGHT